MFLRFDVGFIMCVCTAHSKSRSVVVFARSVRARHTDCAVLGWMRTSREISTQPFLSRSFARRIASFCCTVLRIRIDLVGNCWGFPKYTGRADLYKVNTTYTVFVPNLSTRICATCSWMAHLGNSRMLAVPCFLCRVVGFHRAWCLPILL